MIFHDTGDSSYMNTVDNFCGGTIGDQYFELHFKGTTNASGENSDVIRLAVTDNKEDEVLTFLGDLVTDVIKK